MKGHMFNIDNGYLEGLCRGFKNGGFLDFILFELSNIGVQGSLVRTII